MSTFETAYERNIEHRRLRGKYVHCHKGKTRRRHCLKTFKPARPFIFLNPDRLHPTHESPTRLQVMGGHLTQVLQEVFYLWPFQIGDQIVITRGRDQDEAYQGIAQNLQRGVTVAFLDNMPMDSAMCYDRNHDAGWLHRMPVWLT